MKPKNNIDLNDLVPELLDKTNQCAKNLGDRVKINGIFNEFDLYTHEGFQKFIDMSEERYKSIKSGNKLNAKLKSQNQEYNYLSTNILSNRFYSNKDIDIESKKLKKKMNNDKDNQQIYELRKHIKEKSKNFTEKELKKRERYASAGLYRKRQREKGKKYHQLTRMDLIFRPDNLIQKKFDIQNIPYILENEKKTNKEVDILKEKERYFEKLMDEYCKNINDNIL